MTGVRVGAGEVAKSINCLLYKHANLGLIAQNPSEKLGMLGRAGDASTREAGRQADLWGSAARQPSLPGEPQVPRTDPASENREMATEKQYLRLTSDLQVHTCILTHT